MAERIAITPPDREGNQTYQEGNKTYASQVKNIVERLVSDHTKAYGYTDDAILFGFDEHLEISTLQKALERYIKASGVPAISLHGYRITSAPRVLRHFTAAFEPLS